MWYLSWEQIADLPSNTEDIPMELFFTLFGNAGGTELAAELHIVLLEAQPILYPPLFRSKGISFRLSGFWSILVHFLPISAYSAEPFWKTSSAESILFHSH